MHVCMYDAYHALFILGLAIPAGSRRVLADARALALSVEVPHVGQEDVKAELEGAGLLAILLLGELLACLLGHGTLAGDAPQPLHLLAEQPEPNEGTIVQLDVLRVEQVHIGVELAPGEWR